MNNLTQREGKVGQFEVWMKMRRIIRYIYRQHEGDEFLPNARQQLQNALQEANVNPDMIESFEKDVFSDTWHGEEKVSPLGLTQKYLIAHLLIYQLFGEGHRREHDFIKEAAAAGLQGGEIEEALRDLWPV